MINENGDLLTVCNAKTQCMAIVYDIQIFSILNVIKAVFRCAFKQIYNVLGFPYLPNPYSYLHVKQIAF